MLDTSRWIRGRTSKANAMLDPVRMTVKRDGTAPDRACQQARRSDRRATARSSDREVRRPPGASQTGATSIHIAATTDARGQQRAGYNDPQQRLGTAGATRTEEVFKP